MLKKYLIVIGIIVLLTGFSNFSFASTSNIYIEDAQKTENDDKVTMNVCMENVNSDIVSLSLDIKYDENKLEYIGSRTGKNLKTTVQIAEYTDENNKVAINMMSSSGLKADGVYYQMTFKVLDNKSSEIPVKLELKEASNSSGTAVKCTTKDGVIKTQNSSSKPNNDNQSRK